MLMAVIVTPNFVHVLRSRTLSDFRAALPDVVGKARETAIIKGQAVDLQFDENQRQLQIVQAATQDPNSPTNATATQNTSDAPTFTLSLPTGVDGANYQNPPETTASTAWSVRFYPDGTAAPAGMAFTVDNETYSLVVDARGGGRVVDGGIPDLTTDRWPAGTYVQRTQ
jgi:Tfp pilus assembly protein FimT